MQSHPAAARLGGGCRRLTVRSAWAGAVPPPLAALWGHHRYSRPVGLGLRPLICPSCPCQARSPAGPTPLPADRPPALAVSPRCARPVPPGRGGPSLGGPAMPSSRCRYAARTWRADPRRCQVEHATARGPRPRGPAGRIALGSAASGAQPLRLPATVVCPRAGGPGHPHYASTTLGAAAPSSGNDAIVRMAKAQHRSAFQRSPRQLVPPPAPPSRLGATQPAGSVGARARCLPPGQPNPTHRFREHSAASAQSCLPGPVRTASTWYRFGVPAGRGFRGQAGSSAGCYLSSICRGRRRAGVRKKNQDRRASAR